MGEGLGTYLGHWLDFIGENKQFHSLRLGLSPAAITTAINVGCRASPWLDNLADYVGVPRDILLDVHPLDANPRVREVRDRALAAAARRRLDQRARNSRRKTAVPLKRDI